MPHDLLNQDLTIGDIVRVESDPAPMTVRDLLPELCAVLCKSPGGTWLYPTNTVVKVG